MRVFGGVWKCFGASGDSNLKKSDLELQWEDVCVPDLKLRPRTDPISEIKVLMGSDRKTLRAVKIDKDSDETEDPVEMANIIKEVWGKEVWGKHVEG